MLRHARPTDIRALAELWDRAFPGERTVGDRVRQLESGLPHGGVEIVHVWEEDGRIAGAFKALRLQQVFAGAQLQTLGLAAVAVAPDRRRRGLGAQLCRQALRIGRERGDVMSTLYPFRPAFYRALGWGMAGRLHAHLFDPACLPGYPERDQVRSATQDELPAIADCYRRVALRSNGMLLRHEALWRQLLGDARAYPFVHLSDNGEVGGYLIARFGAGTRPDARVLRIAELVADDDASYRALLGWIASLSDQWRRARYDAHPAERFEHRLADPRPPLHARARSLYFPVARLIAGPMVRVLDVPTALHARDETAPAEARGLELRLEVVDTLLPENRGPWLWSVGAGVTLDEDADDDARRDEIDATGVNARDADPALGEAAANGNTHAAVRTDAATFAQIYAGEVTPGEAAALGLAQIAGDERAADLAFRSTAPFRLLDEF